MVKKTTLFSLLVILAGLVFLFGCDQIQSAFQTSGPTRGSGAQSQKQGEKPQVQGTVLATINGEVITLEKFDENIQNLRALSPDIKIETKEDKKAYLRDLITQELVYQEAIARGIDRQKDVVDAVKDFKKGVMARQLILDETKGITVDPATIEAFYNQHKAKFAEPEQIRAREIVVSSESTAREILISLLQGADFATTAKTRSISSSASKGGDLGVVKPGEKFEKFDEVVSTLEAGEISQIFQGPEGYYIVKVEEKTGGEIPALYEVSDTIKNLLIQDQQAQRLNELTDKLRRNAKIEIKEELL